MIGAGLSAEAVVLAEGALRAGDLAIMPTDTVYGLMAAIDHPAGVAALYETKGRPRARACQVLIYSPDALASIIAGLDGAIALAIRQLLPGSVTCIVDDPAYRFAAAAGDAPGSVGLRSPVIGGPLAGLEIPLIATSANDPGDPDPIALDDVPARIREAVAVELDAGSLPGVASAVVDLRPVAAGGPARLLRPGPNPEDVAEALAEAQVLLAPGP